MLLSSVRIAMAFLICAIVLTARSTTAETPPRPNIVLVLFDDLGWGEPSCNRPESKLRMPNLDRLATEGMRFTDAHSASSVCTPTRYGLLTGQHPFRINQYGVLTTYSAPIIAPNRMTVASLLKQHGYTTACIGKWHLGLTWFDEKPGTESMVPIGAKHRNGPNAVGFDYFCGFTHARNIGTVIEQDTVVAHVASEDNQPLMLRKAVEWIEARREDEPFFLYFPMCPPHTPIAPSQAYRGKSGGVDEVGKDPKYADWVFQGDAMLGELLATLKREQFDDNTLVIVASDNGAAKRSYLPLRASKTSIYEGGHRVPMIWRWPGHITAGSTNDTPVCLNDCMATIADILDVELPRDAGEDSINRAASILGSRIKTDSSGATTPASSIAMVHQSMQRDLAIRLGDWKLIYLKDGTRQLYNLAEDLSEQHNLADQHPEKVNMLDAEMQALKARGRTRP